MELIHTLFSTAAELIHTFIIPVKLIHTLFNMAVGSLITWWVARYYYERASRHLAREAKELKRHNVLMLRVLELNGLVELVRDAAGNITGMLHLTPGKLKAGSATIRGKDDTKKTVVSTPRIRP